MRAFRLALMLPAALALGACFGSGMDRGGREAAPVPAAVPAPVTPGRLTSSNPSGAQPAAPSDAAAAAAGALGSTTASMGDATRAGIWLMTPLVRAPRNGRVVDTATGRSADVELLPLGDPATGESRISHGAMHALGLEPTDVAQLQVFGT